MCCNHCQHQNSYSLAKFPPPTTNNFIVVLPLLYYFDVDLQYHNQLYALLNLGGDALNYLNLCSCGIGCVHFMYALSGFCKISIFSESRVNINLDW